MGLLLWCAAVARGGAVFRRFQAFHKTGTYYARDVGARSCEAFGYADDGCWLLAGVCVCVFSRGQCAARRRAPLDWAQRCLKTAPGAPCAVEPLPGETRRTVVFLREAYERVVSAYLYHRGGGGGVERWTTTPMGALMDGHGKMLRDLVAGGVGAELGFPALANESFARWLGRVPADAGLAAQLRLDATRAHLLMRGRYATCRPPDCHVECLDWHLVDAATTADRWRAIARFALYDAASDRATFEAAAARATSNPTAAHGTTRLVGERERGALRRLVRAIDNRTGGQVARLPWEARCAAPAPRAGLDPPARRRPAATEARRRWWPPWRP